MNIETGQRETVGPLPRHDVRAAVRDRAASKIIMSLSEGASSNLYTMDLASQANHAAYRLIWRSTPRRPIRQTDRGFASNPIAAARSRSTSCRHPAAARSESRSARAATRRRSGRRRAISSPSPSRPRAKAIWSSVSLKPDGSDERILTEGFHNEGPDLGAERPIPHVLPGSRRRGPAAHLHDRRVRPTGIPGADAGRRVRSSLESAARKLNRWELFAPSNSGRRLRSGCWRSR